MWLLLFGLVLAAISTLFVKRNTTQKKQQSEVSIDQETVPTANLSVSIPLCFGYGKFEGSNIVVDGGFNYEINSKITDEDGNVVDPETADGGSSGGGK
ncbi:hypothetical protein [Francisella marina]|uniref:hypothetical protein n=1 Tax=Francisella marina TaxID=2249302 RepID=UPI0011ECCB15|nr:hypothetical protein [Francisella marina]QEO58333.1 hypothetical protein F0R75_00550 [Francisella marina]